jgi:hypothetical protein
MSAYAGAMQISLGDNAAGSMPWMGGGESWVCWRYPYARPVVGLVLYGNAAHAQHNELELARLDSSSGEFVPLENTNMERSSDADSLTLVVKVNFVNAAIT